MLSGLHPFYAKRDVSDIFAGPTIGLWGAIVDN
jgi:hypothetical protein